MQLAACAISLLEQMEVRDIQVGVSNKYQAI